MFRIELFFQASLGPFAWENNITTQSYCRSAKRTREDTFESDEYAGKENLRQVSLVMGHLPQEIRDLPRSAEVFSMIHSNPSLSLKLPPNGASAGRVLDHAACVFQDLQRRHSPLTFKFGITHCPHFRWMNPTYGYRHCFDRFQEMVIIFASKNPDAPSFLEAALIRECGSSMAQIYQAYAFSGG